MSIQQDTTIPDKTLVFDNRLDSYESFFDHDWAGSLFQLVDQTQLGPLAMDLCTDWKGAANTMRLPWLIVHSLESFHTGYLQPNEPFWQKLTRAFRAYLLDKTKHSFSLTKRKELAGIINKVSDEVQEEIGKAPPVFDRQDMWERFLEVEEFSLSLWSSQKLCYGAVYYAYENFLRQCVSIGQKKPSYRAHSTAQLRDDLNTLFGSAIGNTCLDDDKIILARRVRNALVHNGGRATSEIKASPGGLTIMNEMIHVMPPDVRELYNLLKEHITRLAEEARRLPQFRI